MLTHETWKVALLRMHEIHQEYNKFYEPVENDRRLLRQPLPSRGVLPGGSTTECLSVASSASSPGSPSGAAPGLVALASSVLAVGDSSREEETRVSVNDLGLVAPPPRSASVDAMGTITVPQAGIASPLVLGGGLDKRGVLSSPVKLLFPPWWSSYMEVGCRPLCDGRQRDQRAGSRWTSPIRGDGAPHTPRFFKSYSKGGCWAARGPQSGARKLNLRGAWMADKW
jgi:hypothetical protein